MEHHIARDLLAGYAEGSLEPETLREVQEHVAACTECGELLEGDRPVQLPLIAGPAPWSEKKTMKTARRALLRAALSAGLIYLVAWLPLSLMASSAASAVIERNGRGLDAERAAAAIGSMLIPGGRVDSSSTARGFLRREYSARVRRRIGGIDHTVADIWVKLGVIGASMRVVPAASDTQFPPNPYSSTFNPTGLSTGLPGGLQPDVLPDGSVVTVQMIFQEPLSYDDAEKRLADLCRPPTQGATDQPRAVRKPIDSPGAPGLSFGPPPLSHPAPSAVEAPIGERTVQPSGIPPMVTWVGFAAGPDWASAGFSSGGDLRPTGYVGAPAGCNLREARSRVLASLTLLSRTEFEGFFAEDLIHTRSTRGSPNVTPLEMVTKKPRIVTLVVTGPVRNVERLLDQTKPSAVFKLDQDLYNY